MAKPKHYQHLKRKQHARRQRFDRVLIVCEGESEAAYLGELCRALRLPGVRIIARGAGPVAVWKRACEEFDRDQDYDHVACVFDRDTHQDYSATLAEIRQHGAQGRIGRRKARATRLMAVPSDPCFEYWLLLHFQATTATFTGPNEVISRLRRCEGMADYQKADAGVFGHLQPRLDTALANARQVRQATLESGADSPVTGFDELVDYLLEQGRRHAPQS